MTPISERKLIKKAPTDFSAYAKLYTHYQPKIYAYCLNRLANKEVAEDITGQVFLASIEKIKDFEVIKGASLGSWLYRVAHNKITDYFRSAKFNKRAHLEVEQHRSKDKTEKLAELTEHQIQVAAVLKRLNKRYQQALSLRFYAELKNDEIAEVMKLKKPQVPVIIHRALKSFKKLYEKEFPDSEIF